MHLAAEKGRLVVCQHLLELRADISAVDNVSCLNRSSSLKCLYFEEWRKNRVQYPYYKNMLVHVGYTQSDPDGTEDPDGIAPAGIAFFTASVEWNV